MFLWQIHGFYAFYATHNASPITHLILCHFYPFRIVVNHHHPPATQPPHNLMCNIKKFISAVLGLENSEKRTLVKKENERDESENNNMGGGGGGWVNIFSLFIAHTKKSHFLRFLC